MPHLGNKLKAYRSGKNWTQAEMAEFIGVKSRTYQSIEKTGDVKKSDVLEKIYLKTKIDTQKDIDSNAQIFAEADAEYGLIKDINPKDIQSRLLRIEANLEVIQVAIAGLKSKNKEDFAQRFSELQTLIEQAVRRRLGQV